MITNWMLRAKRFLLPTFIFLLCTSCANHHFRVATEAPSANVPRYLELESAVQLATLHFPAGPYVFYAADDAGYYYRAPRQLVQHTGGASVMRNGGIYVSKRNANKLRGYVMMPGGLTHVGDLSKSRHEFRD